MNERKIYWESNVRILWVLNVYVTWAVFQIQKSIGKSAKSVLLSKVHVINAILFRTKTNKRRVTDLESEQAREKMMERWTEHWERATNIMKMVWWCWCLLNTRIVFLSLEIALAVGIYGILRMKTRAMWITKAYGKVNVLAISIPFSIHTSGCLVSLTRGDPCPLSLYAWENSQQSTHFALQPSNLNDNTAIQPTIQASSPTNFRTSHVVSASMVLCSQHL